MVLESVLIRTVLSAVTPLAHLSTRLSIAGVRSPSPIRLVSSLSCSISIVDTPIRTAFLCSGLNLDLSRARSTVARTAINL